jgi:hypothetical protein
MRGTVTRLRPRGVEALMDGPTDTLEEGTQFRIYRSVNGQDFEVGTGYSRRSKGPNLICLNATPGRGNGEDLVQLNDPQIGDLVESI